MIVDDHRHFPTPYGDWLRWWLYSYFSAPLLDDESICSFPAKGMIATPVVQVDCG